MKKIGCVLVYVLAVLSVLDAPAWAGWVNLSQNLPEVNIQTMAVDPNNAKLIYAGSEKRVYKSMDGGSSWKQILGVRGTENQVKFIYIDPERTQHVYVATARGIERSREGGKHWETFFRGLEGASKTVYCVAPDLRVPGKFWIGTGNGLLSLNRDGNDMKIISGPPKAAVHSILISRKIPNLILIGTDKGIYKSKDGGTHWERVLVIPQTTESAEGLGGSETLEQFNVEEIMPPMVPSNVIFLENLNKFYSATDRGIFESSENAQDWTVLKGQALPASRINTLTESEQTFYAATDRGIFQWDRSQSAFKDISDGLESKEVKSLFYDARTDTLLAGTRKGLFKFEHPEFDAQSLFTTVGEQDRSLVIARTNQFLKLFDVEPTIREIQNAAIKYGEVHPKKIEQWRSAAARKAWFPTLSAHRSLNSNQNVDLDRGGTGDADKFIIGPDEKSNDWYVGASWNLDELIWNGDQTSIDTRSRLMVELRDDILTEVTHLYYERRRVQVDMAMSPAVDMPLWLEKQIRLEELTAGIDALTGGYLSDHLSQNPSVKIN